MYFGQGQDFKLTTELSENSNIPATKKELCVFRETKRKVIRIFYA